MRRSYRYSLVVLVAVLFSAGVLFYVLADDKVTIDRWDWIDRPPRIQPDYSQTVVPPNIAALNFLVAEKGTHYCVKIYSKQNPTIEVFSRKSKIVIPEKRWHELLNNNNGQQLYFDVFVQKQNNHWLRFKTIANTIAAEKIDNYIAYRRIYPVHSFWNKIGIYQRNLHNYDERPILKNDGFETGCLNCHTFCNNRTDKMLIGIRSAEYGSSTLLIEDGQVNKIGTKTGYSCWHPSGRMAVYSVNKVRQFYHTARNEVRDVLDLDSLLAYYIVDDKVIKTTPVLSQKKRLETYPTWSPDGRYLYFCSAAMLWSDQNKLPPDFHDEVRYDLVRVSYDLDSDRWGKTETVLSSDNTGLSILEPRISPDGRWLLFCMCDYGCFPVYQKNSDLYLMDLEAAAKTGRYDYRRLDINSDHSESWHTWSSNSRWIAFSSKRHNGVFTRIYLSYVDRNGRVYKPILMPQKDPTLYDHCLDAFNTPEFTVDAVQAAGEKLARAVRGSEKITVEMPITMATPAAGQTPPAEPWFQERE